MNCWGIRAYLLSLVLLQIPGCMTVRVRELSWPGIAARKECAWWLQPMPKTVWFDNVVIYMDRNSAPFTLKMPKGDVIASNDLTRERLKQHFSSVKPLTSDYAPETEHAEIRFEHGSVSVMLIGEKVNRVTVGSWFRQRPKAGGTRPSIGDANGKRFLSFPASEQQLIDFFGKPTSAQTYLFDT
jgi:hypothetical protein